MAIVSFWSNGKSETGKSSAIIALATLLGVNHNYKILVLDTKMNDYFYHDCFWKEDKTIKKINNSNVKTDVGHGISGLSKAILSNKTSPEIVTNYTKIVFKDRLELLMDTNVDEAEYETHKTIFRDIIRMANRYYDLIFVDIDNSLDAKVKDALLEESNLIVACLPQKLRELDKFIIEREENPILKSKSILPLLGRYDRHSKYNEKNVARYLKEKKGICSIPYNTLFFEACNEATLADYFIKFRKLDAKDMNGLFIADVRRTAEKIVSRLQELQMRV